jgi:hypothetical protein
MNGQQRESRRPWRFGLGLLAMFALLNHLVSLVRSVDQDAAYRDALSQVVAKSTASKASMGSMV